MSQDTAAVGFWIELSLAELRTANAGDAVILGHPFIEEGVAGREEFHHTAVFPHDVVKEFLGFLLHGQGQFRIKLRKLFLVRRHHIQGAQFQPLAAEVFGQRAGFRVL